MFKNDYYKINLLFIFISTASIFQSAYSLIIDENIYSVILTYSISLFIVLLQFILLIKLESIKINTILNITKNNLIILFISICLTINIVTCIFTLLISFNSLAIFYKLFTIIFFFIIIFFILKKIMNSEFLLIFLIIFFITFNLFNLFQMAKAINKEYFYRNENNDNNNDFNKIINYSKFIKKPNLHIFLFDALIPNYTSNKYLDIKETSYYKFLKQEKAIIFKNSFTDIPGTRPTLNSLLYLNIEKYTNLDEKYNFFNGIADSPLFSLFKYNDYQIIINNHWKKSKKGNFVDVDIGQALSVPHYCNLEGRIYKIRFLGTCLITSYFINQNMHFANQINHLAKDKQSLLSINFINYPSHMAGSNFVRYKNQFLKNQEKVKDIMESAMKDLKKNKEGSILLFFGDHGILKHNSPKLNYKDDINLIIEDQHMVLIALIDQNNICSNIFLGTKFKFATPIFVLENILKCLTNKVNVTAEKNDYSIFFDINTLKKAETKFTKYDFLYEK